MHQSVLQRFAQLPNVAAIYLLGSAADETTDSWSDTDVLLVMREYHQPKSTVDTVIVVLSANGSLFNVAINDADPDHIVVRACFDSFERYDVVIVTQHWLQSNGLSPPYRRVFTDMIFNEATMNAMLTSMTPQQSLFKGHKVSAVSSIATTFREKAITAVVKTVREDLLIAAHLTLDLWREVMVLWMMFRDNEAGTNIHKTGGVGNKLLQATQSLDVQTPLGILHAIEGACLQFDDAARLVSPEYSGNSQPLISAIARARKQLAQHD